MVSLFHHKHHPIEMGKAEIEAFFTHLAVQQQVSASTQNQALSALLFLYREVLKLDLTDIDAVRAKRPQCVLTVLTKPGAIAIIQSSQFPALARFEQLPCWKSAATLSPAALQHR